MTIDPYNVAESSLGLAVGGIVLRLFDRLWHKCCTAEEPPAATVSGEAPWEQEPEHLPSDGEESVATILPPFPEKENLTDI